MRRSVACSQSCLLLDFDGTLSEIVEDPQSARVVDGGEALLRRLEDVMGLVGVVSGRPLSFLEERFPLETHPNLALAGSYGAERVRWRSQENQEEPQGVDEQRLDLLKSQLLPLAELGVDVEVKPVSVTLHYRRHPEAEHYVHGAVQRLQRDLGVFPIMAKCAVEVFVETPPSKGSVVLHWGRGWERVIYIGDDRSDLEAFDALSELENQGATVLRIAVVAHGVASILRDRADFILDDPTHVVQWLSTLEKLCLAGRH